MGCPDTTTATFTPTYTATATQSPVEQGQLKVCKVAGTGVSVGQVFTFLINGVSYDVPSGLGGGFCVLAGDYRLDAQVTIQEMIPAGIEVGRIEVWPTYLTVSQNPALGLAAVRIGPGVTEVLVTNQVIGVPITPTPTKAGTATPCGPSCNPTATPRPIGRMEICVEADGDGVSGDFTFEYAGRTTTVPTVVCSPILNAAAGPLTVSQVPKAGYTVTNIYSIPADRLISVDIPSATVTIVEGSSVSETVVVFRIALTDTTTTARIYGRSPPGRFSQILFCPVSQDCPDVTSGQFFHFVL